MSIFRMSRRERVLAVLDVLQSKLIRRGISLKSLDTGEPFPSGKEFRLEATIKEGIAQDLAKNDARVYAALGTYYRRHGNERANGMP